MNMLNLIAVVLLKLAAPSDYRDEAIGDLNQAYNKKRLSGSEFSASLYSFKVAIVSSIHFSLFRFKRVKLKEQTIVNLLTGFWLIIFAFFTLFMQWLSNLNFTNKFDVAALNRIVAGQFNLVVTEGEFWQAVGNNITQGKGILCLTDANAAIISLLTLLGAVLVLKFTQSKLTALTSVSILLLLPFIAGTVFLNLNANDMTLDNVGSILTPMLLSTFYSSIAFIGLSLIKNKRTHYA